jgi:hypothetical protein
MNSDEQDAIDAAWFHADETARLWADVIGADPAYLAWLERIAQDNIRYQKEQDNAESQ